MTSPVNSSLNSSPPLSPSLPRYQKKVSPQTSNTTPLAGWNKARVVTPDRSFGYRSPQGLELAQGAVQLFASKKNSQGLIKNDQGQVAACSTTTTIRTQTPRTSEKKSTHIQYDKKRLQEGEFPVKVISLGGKIAYEGGHLIDHKFSAKNSHTTPSNYIPEIKIYNSPLKEYLVKRSDDYVEIPIYTPNPPMVGVLHENRSQAIPIGVVFIQIKDKTIQDVYYFPNNTFDYEKLKSQIKTKPLSKGMLPYFKLSKDLHPLFRCALIEHVSSAQKANESEFSKVMDLITEGMSLTKVDQNEDNITAVASEIVHNSPSLNPHLFLDCSQDAFKKIDSDPLKESFIPFANYLILSSLRNCLKSEVISIHSRLVFASTLIDFIEASEEVSDESLDFVDNLTDIFKALFNELEDIKKTMNQQELFFFTDLYKRLSSPFLHAFSIQNQGIYFDHFENFYEKFIANLEQIVQRFSIENLDENRRPQFLALIDDANTTLNYLIETGFPLEECPSLQRATTLLKQVKQPYQQLVKNLPSPVISFASNIHRQTLIRTVPAYFTQLLFHTTPSSSDSTTHSNIFDRAPTPRSLTESPTSPSSQKDPLEPRSQSL